MLAGMLHVAHARHGRIDSLGPSPVLLPVMRIDLDVNGDRHEVEVDGSQRLLDVLRDDLGLLGSEAGVR